MTQTNAEGKAAGALRTDQSQLLNSEGFSFSGYERDPLYLNLKGEKYKDISGVSGIDSISDGRAGVFADFDNDGDYDVFLTTIQGESHLLFRNNVGQDGKYLRISLEGGKGVGRDAFGAVVRVRTSAGTLTKIKSGGAGFISQHDARLVFGLGSDERAQSIQVTWPNGRVEEFGAEAKAGSSLLLREGTGRAETLAVRSAKLPDPITRAESLARGLKVAVGGALPDIPLKTVDGGVTSLRKQLRPGRRAIINVWATWCAPCAREMPELERLRAGLTARGIDLIGLNVDEPGADVKGFLNRMRVGYPTYVGGAEAVERLYATGELLVPLSIVVDEQGRVTELITGWSGETQRKFEGWANHQDAKGSR